MLFGGATGDYQWSLRVGRGDVTFLLHIAYVKSTKNVGKLACVFGRFKNPFFLWLIQILKAVTMIMVTAIAFFWSFTRNPAIMRQIVLSPVLTHGDKPGHHGKGRNYTLVRITLNALILRITGTTGYAHILCSLKKNQEPVPVLFSKATFTVSTFVTRNYFAPTTV